MANAYMVGDGNDVTAEVRVNGVMIDHSPIKLADVTTGLDIEVTAATGLQCEAPAGEDTAVATIMFTEGFSSAIRAVADDTELWTGRRIQRGKRRPRVEFPRHSRRRDRDGEPDGNRRGNGA